MSIIYYILGFGLTLLVTVDLIWTTLWIDGGAGPLSDNLTSLLWKILRKINNKLLLNISGPLILIAILLSWFLIVWLGVTLIFAANPESIVNPSTGDPVSWIERIYFSGFTIFTLGIGDYTPQSGFFQLVTAFSSGLGMMVLTLSVSYVISVVDAVVQKRSFSRSISGLGRNSIELINKVWNGQDFHQFDLILSTVNTQITELTQQNQAFPLLQYYHSESVEKTSAVNIIVLDEALSLLRYGVKQDDPIMHTALIEATQSSIQTYLDTVIEGYGNEAKKIEDVPPVMNLSLIKDSELPLTVESDYYKKMEDLSDRRNKLLSIARGDNHEWPNPES